MPAMSARLARTIAIAVLLGLALFALPEGCRGGTAADFTGVAYSCQLHVHGPYSEGIASIDSHTFEASQLGLDVIWWSDHDFRATSYNHVGRYGFEAFEEPQARGEAWSLALVRRESDTKGVRLLRGAPGGRAELVEEPVREGERALRLETSADTQAFQPYSWTFETRRLLHRRPLASRPTVRIGLYPEALDEDARAFLRIDLSEHAPRGGEVPEAYALRYVLVQDDRDAWREGNVYHIPLSFEAGRWNELTLDLQRDAAAGFPFLPGLPGEDHSLFGLSFGVAARRGARASIVLDDLRIDQELDGPPAFVHQGRLIESFGNGPPLQLQGVEVSFAARHLNEFSVETGLLDYDALAREAGFDPEAPELFDEQGFKALVVERAVEEAHARGGLISWNHMFGVNPTGSERRKTREQQLEILLKNDAFGVDLLEVGYRDRAGASLSDHLWVWDQAALAGLRLVGTGVSDSHGGPDARWRTSPNNFISWVYAQEPTKAALIEGLRAGRVFFGDLVLFDGDLDLVTDTGQRMGAEVETDRDELKVRLMARGLRGGERVQVVLGGEVVRTFSVTGPSFHRSITVAPGERGTFVRFEIYDAEDRAVAFSNPIYFLRPYPSDAR